MKIIEKKCPNCGANLDFKVGERDVSCGSCRRKFAIEYNHDEDFDSLNEAALNSLSSNDFNLTSVKRKVITTICLMAFFAVVILTIIVVVNTDRSKNDFDEIEKRRREEYEQTEQQRKEDFEKEAKRMREEFEQNVQQNKENYEQNFEHLRSNE